MVFGGHGYIHEWGMEQCIRDLRIAQIYEGTNGVQSQDLIGRKTIKCGGAFIAEYITEIRDFANDLDTDLNFIKDATLDAATEIEAITQFIIEQAAENVEFPNSAAVDYLHAVGLLSFSYMFAKITAAAKISLVISTKTNLHWLNTLLNVSCRILMRVLLKSKRVQI